MPGMTAASAIQRFCAAVGVPQPSDPFGDSTSTTAQMLELLNQEGRSLSRRYDWQELTFEATFTTAAAESQGTLTSIIGATQQLRKIVNDTIWNRTTKQPIFGPLSKQTWQAQKALSISGPFPQYRIRENTLRFIPNPTAGQTCAFEYVSSCWLQASGAGAFKVNVSANTDTILLNEELVMAGMEWRWLRKKGLSYSEEFNSYERLVKSEMSINGTKATLRMDGASNKMRPGITVPIGSWNLP